jgi:hypothetical protein
LRDTYERAQIYRLDVVRFVLIDNSRGFGHKDVLELEQFPIHSNRKPL